MLDPDVSILLALAAAALLELPGERFCVAGYCLAAAAYIAIGVAWIDFLLSFWVAVAYVLVTLWLLPAATRRLR